MTFPRAVADEERYALYTIRDAPTGRPQTVRLAETSLDGVGLTLETLAGEGEFTDDAGRQTPFGLYDRRTGWWVVRPWKASR